MTTPRLRLGQLLVDARLISEADLEEVLRVQKSDGRRIGTLLVEQGLINETQLTQILSHQLAVPWVSLLHIEFSRQLLNLVPKEVIDRYCLLPIYVRHVRGQGETLYVAMDDPSNEEALAACGAYSGLPVRAMIAPPSDIRSAIRVYFGGGKEEPIAPLRAQDPSTSGDVDEASWAPPPRSERPPRSLRSAAPREAAPANEREPLAGPAPSTPAPDPDVRLPGPPASPADVAPPPSSPPKPRTSPSGRGPRMVALTLLDGTTINLPARKSARTAPAATEAGAPVSDETSAPASVDHHLTARDLIVALRAVAHGADASEVLGDVRWENLYAALLSVLLKKHLIADWELIEELKKL